jgi:alpha-methylacyl-CoA racemase
MERLGLAPDICLKANPRLVYARMTGWGQDGPLAELPGRDINYTALSGALHPIGRAGEPPVPPPMMLGDFGGGRMLLGFGILAALVERSRSGEGQVVDAAVLDGTALLTVGIHALRATGRWRDERGTNRLDTGAPFYEAYETADERFVSVGAIEPGLFGELLQVLGIRAPEPFDAGDPAGWRELKADLAAVFRTRSRDSWCELLEARGLCVVPVLSPAEAPSHPHNRHRRTFEVVDGVAQPAPAPRFGRTPSGPTTSPPRAGANTADVLQASGYTDHEIDELRTAGVVA